MRRWRGRTAVLLLSTWGLTMATAYAAPVPGPATVPTGPWREQIHWIPVTEPDGTPRLLWTRVCRPATNTPARVLVYAHGTAPTRAARLNQSALSCSSDAAQWFLARGFMVISALRRGYGATGGAFADTSHGCDIDDARARGLEIARDIAATVAYATALPGAQRAGAVVLGQSAGGWGSIAYDSLPHPAVTAIINMAGGIGGWRDGRPLQNCHPERLAREAGVFGRIATTPMLWIYTANDSFFGPVIARAMYQAFTEAGGTAEFNAIGAYGNDGHGLFSGREATPIWGPLVERYLALRPAS